MKRSSDLRERISSRSNYDSKRPRTEPRKEFDLTPTDKKNEVFKVAFDYYTPRAHFVILPRDGVEIGNDYNDLSSNKRRELVQVASTIVSEFKLKKIATLAVHRGSWITTKHMFHAHVCSDVEDYIKVFHDKEQEIPDWPSTRYVTKQWRASRNPREYEANVRGYPFKTYVKEEIQDVKDLRKKAAPIKESEDSESKIPSSKEEYEKFRLLYHPKEPRVGFISPEKKEFSTDDYLKVLDAMNKFAGKNNLTDINSKGDDKGCHLCVVFNGLKHGFELEENSVLLGYLQMSGPKYYKDFCPEEKKETWFQHFSANTDYKVYT